MKEVVMLCLAYHDDSIAQLGELDSRTKAEAHICPLLVQ
jgi:hypothetical protein